MRLVPFILVGACHRPAPRPILSNEAPRAATELRITQTTVGPLDVSARATLSELRARLVGYEVRPVHDGSLQFDVFRGGERLMFVVPEDDGTIFNIHAVSERVTVDGRAWRVARPFWDSARLTRCECWGSNPTCYAAGEHVAVNFGRACDGLTDNSATPRSFRALDGAIVQRVIWSPTPFGEDPHGEGEGGL